MISRFRYVAISVFCLSLTTSALGNQPQKFLVVEPSIDKQWIQAHGTEYHYVWQSRNDGKNAALWRQYSPDTLLSSYFPYMRDPTGKSPHEWLVEHPDWILYRCDGKIAFQFGNSIVPLDITNHRVREWQIKLFSASWQPDIGLDNFQLGDRERVCVEKIQNNDYIQNDKETDDRTKFRNAKLIWLEGVAQSLHKVGKTLTVNYSLDVPPDSQSAKRLLNSVDGVLYEDYWGDQFKRGMFSSTNRMLDLQKFFSDATKKNKRLYFIFQLPEVNNENIQTAMAAYLINSSSQSAVYISAVQRYGIVPGFYGYDKTIGDACGPAVIGHETIVRRFAGADVVLHLPSAPPVIIRVNYGHYLDVNGNNLDSEIILSNGSGLILYKSGNNNCIPAPIALKILRQFQRRLRKLTTTYNIKK
ncbi:hypothetical protein [Paraburkholderia tropica]|uniref:hypothetical protein n=1 Tax=Paraburkholderia tropica TaxID=92647 RepID=UPI0031DA2B29